MSIIQETLNELQRRLQVAQGKRLTQKELAILAQTSDRTIAEWMRGATAPQAMAALLNLLVELPPNEATAVLEYWKVHAPKRNLRDVARKTGTMRRHITKPHWESEEIS